MYTPPIIGQSCISQDYIQRSDGLIEATEDCDWSTLDWIIK